jgi:hypothetical protein
MTNRRRALAAFAGLITALAAGCAASPAWRLCEPRSLLRYGERVLRDGG